jgi:hypothetical protein
MLKLGVYGWNINHLVTGEIITLPKYGLVQCSTNGWIIGCKLLGFLCCCYYILTIWHTILTSSLQHSTIIKRVWHVKKRHHLSTISAQNYFENQQTILDETSVSIFSHIVLSSALLNSENDITLSCLAVTDRRGGSHWHFLLTISKTSTCQLMADKVIADSMNINVS